MTKSIFCPPVDLSIPSTQKEKKEHQQKLKNWQQKIEEAKEIFSTPLNVISDQSHDAAQNPSANLPANRK